MASWTAIDDVDAENGGLLVVPESHNVDLMCHGVPDPRVERVGTTKIHIPKGLPKPVQTVMQPGDTLFFHGNTIHGSGPNRSKHRFRRSWICHYARGDLDRISRFYNPLVCMDGSDYIAKADPGGGPCGDAWEGAAGY